jgi:hypothetical protein
MHLTEEEIMKQVVVVLAALLLNIYVPAQSPEQSIAQGIAQLKKLDGNWERIIATGPGGSPADPLSPVPRMVREWNINSIPPLIPHLSDTTLTKSFRFRRDRTKYVVPVNEYVIHIINQITGHVFWPPERLSVIGNVEEPGRGEPVDLEELKARIKFWWDENHTKTPLERRVADLDDRDAINRFRAYEWLGQPDLELGRVALEGKLNALLKDPSLNTMKYSELAAVVSSLARIGKKESAAPVLRACEYMDKLLLNSVRPGDLTSVYPGGDFLAEYFTCYQGLAALTRVEDVAARLSGFRNANSVNMPEQKLKEFDQRLREITRNRAKQLPTQ